MTMALTIQFVAATLSVILGAFLFGWAICKALSFEDRKEGVSKPMLTDILQALFDAKQAGDEKEIEQNYWALEQLGMDRMTADEVLRAGKKFFGRKECQTTSSPD